MPTAPSHKLATSKHVNDADREIFQVLDTLKIRGDSLSCKTFLYWGMSRSWHGHQQEATLHNYTVGSAIDDLNDMINNTPPQNKLFTHLESLQGNIIRFGMKPKRLKPEMISPEQQIIHVS